MRERRYVAGKSGVMTAINEGPYAMVPITDRTLGPRKADISSMYNDV